MRISEHVSKISVDYCLEADIGALLWKDFSWIPDISEYLGEIEGVDDATLYGATDGTTEIRVDIRTNEDPEFGPTTELVREWVMGRIASLVLDIGRFIRHVPRGDRERGEIEPAFTSEDFVIAYDSRGGCFSLNWHADGDNHKLDIDPGKWIVDEMIEIRQRKSIYKVERNDLTFELWAERKMRNAAAAPPPLR